MNELIDIAFIASKIAAIKDEKSRMIAGSASLAYNLTQIMRFRSMIVDLSQQCNCIVYRAQLRGIYTQEELSLALDCQKQIAESNNQIHCCPVKDKLISLHPFIYGIYRGFYFSI